MKYRRYAPLVAVLLAAAGGLSASAATFTLDQQTNVVAPSTRGGANTTYFGWESFNDAGNRAVPIDDSTPDMGDIAILGVNVKTLNNEDHVLDSGNIYISAGDHTLQEQVTVVTSIPNGTPVTGNGSGNTTVIAQLLTAFGPFPGNVSLSSINGVLPTVIRGTNAAGAEQVFAKWVLPGNAPSYVFTINGVPSVANYSITRIVIDTHWDAALPQPDVVIAASQPTFKIDQVAGIITPTTRGNANTTWFGWDTFCDVGFDTVPINDTTPDIGTTTTGVSFVTTNAQDHISSTRNLYVAAGTLAEEVTVVTDGVVHATEGFTTIIAQAATAFGGFPSSSLSFGSIEGVAPQVVVGNNINGAGQVWAKWKIPGNKTSYTFTVSGPANQSGWSFDKFVVDTLYSPTAFQPDTVTPGNPALNVVLDQAIDVLAPSSRGNLHTTHFGWEVFTNPEANAVAPINDITPDIGNTSITGVSIVGQTAEDHLSSTNNVYVGTAGQKLNERVTVVTNAPPGTPATGAGSGSTTIIAQVVAQAGAIRTPIYFSFINGIAPTYITATNAAGKGQIWALWTIPGNPASSYSFDMTSDTVTGPAVSISLDRLVVDTVWRPSGAQPDKIIVTTPAIASALGSVAAVVKPSTRGNVRTTHFGWETFNDIGNRTFMTSVIDDSTPDIGYTTTAGARFRTTNGQGHTNGNLYFIGGTLAEEITVPTTGTVHATNGYTSIILQIASAPAPPIEGANSSFADTITATIDGVPPTSVVQGVNSTATGQYWAKWNIPGNKATYTILISGPSGQAHYSFDRVTVDTAFSATAFQGDSMAELPVSISSTSPLAVGGLNAVYSVQLAAASGTAPLAFSVSTGTLPAGLTLSVTGLLSGTPTALGASNFTVLVTDANGLTASKAFATTITTSPSITSASTLVTRLVNAPFNTTLAAENGTAPYAWTLSAGTLQTGLTLSTAGVISGTPTATGAASVTVQVADANGLTATKVFDLLITTSPAITSTSPLTLGVTGVSYNATLTAENGTAPYSWTLSSGTLPAGLSLSPGGVISGTTALVGTSTFSVLVTDANLFTATQEFSVTFQNLAITSASALPGAVKGMPYAFSVAGAGGIGDRTFALIGTLPTGLTFNAGVITGTPTVAAATPTTTTFSVQLTDSSSYMVSKDFSITVFAKLQKPVVNPFDLGVTTIGTEFAPVVLTATNYPSSFTVTGLPKGLTAKLTTNTTTKITIVTLSGRTAMSGRFNVQVTAKNTGGTSNVVTGPITVKAVATSLIGTYAGTITRDATANTSLGSKFALVTTTSGSYSLKVTTGAKTLSTTGFLNAAAPHINVPNYPAGALTFVLGSDLVTGNHGAASVTGWRTPWNATSNPASTREGYYSIAIDPVGAPDDAIPQGSGFATFTVSASGAMTIAGKTADGQNIVSSDLLGPDGQFALYTSLYAAKGSIFGDLELAEDEYGEFFGNTVSGDLTWHKVATTGKVYAAAFAAPVILTAEGNYLAASAKEVAVLGLPNTGVTNELVFLNGGISTFAATQPNFSFTFSDDNKVIAGAPGSETNPGKVTLTINAATGAVSGKFTLTEATAANTRKDVPFVGQIVRLADGTTKAVGHFLLPQLAPSTVSLSGGIEIRQSIAH
ncbi:MAG: putative Ig domain-containing protein [Verrucomicrobiota bacterium]